MDQADKALPEVFIEIFGEKKNLIPSFGTFARYEKVTGKNAMDPMSWIQPSATDICYLIWSALGGEKCGYSVEEVSDQLQPKHLEDVKKLVQSMFKRGELTEDQKKDEPAVVAPE